ncbi:hypothetical protein F4779DRAFT_616239 [Xylariaceae sp. FL0662B]|nr:hypothetical protein F4779DRAFT_616239 [Xylariaceae sp. FL0662B]
MDQPSRILAQAREHLEALKQSGLSRDTLLALLEEDPPQQAQQQQWRNTTAGASAAHNIPNFSYRDINPASFNPPPPFRSSVASTSSSSSRESVFSSTSAQSSASSTAAPTAEAKFWCTSCDKTFKRKFDWKRHEEEFHERSRKYPCPNCNQSFWGPNTFNQHHKSAHGCKTCPHADSVVKHMSKRRAWGCGFCAAMHSKFEKHIDHVAAHFESGSTKADWLHSNVIYGLLHQHLVHEAWKALITRKQSRFNGHQPMFSWSPESTGRAQGFVENENPGQLQDLLEFFNGTKESAEKIVDEAYTCVHVIFRPRSSSISQGSPQQPSPTSPTNPYKHVSVMPKTGKAPRRSASTSAVPSASGFGLSRGAPASNDYRRTVASPAPTNIANIGATPAVQPRSMVNMYQSQSSLQPAADSQPRAFTSNADKELPPAPLAPTSPMDMDFPSFETSDPGFLPPLDLSDDWHSLTSTLVDERSSLATSAFPMTWDDLGQFQMQS